MRARWNQTTEAILTTLSAKKGASSEDIARRIKATVTTVSTTLLRLFKAGNVEREKVQDGEVVLDEEEGVTRPRHIYRYSITEKGIRRLEWITGSKKRRK